MRKDELREGGTHHEMNIGSLDLVLVDEVLVACETLNAEGVSADTWLALETFHGGDILRALLDAQSIPKVIVS